MGPLLTMADHQNDCIIRGEHLPIANSQCVASFGNHTLYLFAHGSILHTSGVLFWCGSVRLLLHLTLAESSV